MTGINGTKYQNLNYTYDSASDIQSIYDGVHTGAASATLSSVTYDDLYRVTSVNSVARGLVFYGYNSIGNILTNEDFGFGTYQYTVKPHAVTSANGVAYAYDACGNMTSRGNQTLVYDAQNRLIQVTATNDSVTFAYDDGGKRLWRSGTNGFAMWIGSVFEINTSNIMYHIMANNRRIATFQSACTTTNGIFYYYHSDHLGSASVLTDRSGNEVQHYEYTPFGSAGFTENSSAFPISNRYTDKTYDYETGLYYYGSRYYDPQLGRFIQADPTVPGIGGSQILNRYSYTLNNPLELVDPDGNSPYPGYQWYNSGTWIIPKVGSWSGAVGNSFWTPPNGSVAFAKTGGLPIRFFYGVPDFAPYAEHISVGGIDLPSTFRVANLTGDSAGDRRLAIEELSTRTEIDEVEIDRALRNNDVTIHHFFDGEMQLVSSDLNGAGNVPHAGPASALRNGFDVKPPLNYGDSVGVGMGKVIGIIGIIGFIMDPASAVGGPTSTMGDATATGAFERDYSKYESILSNPVGQDTADIQNALDFINSGFTLGAPSDSQNAITFINYTQLFINSQLSTLYNGNSLMQFNYVPPVDVSGTPGDQSPAPPPPEF